MNGTYKAGAQDRLREAGIRVTGPRVRVYEYLLEHKTHPTCDDIYSGLKTEDDTLSLASVYNVTSLLSQAGLITEIVSPDGQKHYDSDIEFHGHFYCRSCGSILDVKSLGNFNTDKLRGARIDTVSLMISGLCADCVAIENA